MSFHRGMADSPMCERYGMAPETPLHALRDCIWARQVWLPFLSDTQDTGFLGLTCGDGCMIIYIIIPIQIACLTD